jgi:choline kinase
MRTESAVEPVPTFARGFQEAIGFGRPDMGFVASAPDVAEQHAKKGNGWPAQALILAAGGGSRLGEGAKCLCEIGGRPLIEHQLSSLASAGVRSIGVVVGFEQERVRRVVGDRATYIVNERYAETNSLYSFMLARGWIRGDVLVLNCDVLFDPRLAQMLQDRHRNALLFDSDSGAEAEEMKVALQGDCLDEMSKELPPERTEGENVGMLRLDRHAAQHALEEAERLVAGGGQRQWLASAINRTARRHKFKCVDVAGLPWTEIDFPHDLERARRWVWPAIVASRATGRRRVLRWPAAEEAAA